MSNDTLKYSYQLNLSFWIGIISLIGGITIFLLWAGAKYFFLTDLIFLEQCGAFWMTLFHWLCLTSLVLLSVYIYQNWANRHLKMWVTLIILLSNLPVAFGIVVAATEMETLAYVRVDNVSNQTMQNVVLVKEDSTLLRLPDIEPYQSERLIFTYSHYRGDVILFNLDNNNITDSIRIWGGTRNGVFEVLGPNQKAEFHNRRPHFMF